MRQTKTLDFLLPVIPCNGIIPSILVCFILVSGRKQRTQKFLCVVIYFDYTRNPSSQLALYLHIPASPTPHAWEPQIWKTLVLDFLKEKIKPQMVTPLPCIHESTLQTKMMISRKTVINFVVFLALSFGLQTTGRLLKDPKDRQKTQEEERNSSWVLLQPKTQRAPQSFSS